ncbi:MAG: FkbM family methyltransferase [Pirellulaceae bacterium]
MKLREFFYMLGLKPKPQTYGHVIKEQHIAGKTIHYADWLHPRAYPCAVKPQELDYLQGILQDGDVAIDIGAHIGDSTLPIALAVGQAGAVLAFEANPYTAAVLEVNAALNQNIGKIHPHNLAVTDETRMYEFSYNDPGFMNGGAVEQTRDVRHGDAFRIHVQGVHLESFLDNEYPQLISRIKYIKIDAEGYDYYILQSMSSLLDRIRPVIQAEVMQRTSAEYRTNMFNFLQSKGYRVQRYDNCQALEVLSTHREMSNYDNFDICCTPLEQVAMRESIAQAS